MDAQLPSWARFITDPPRVSSYKGSFVDATDWKDGFSRVRFIIGTEDQQISLNIAQAAAIVEMLRELGAEYGAK